MTQENLQAIQDTTVLSFSVDRELLARREAALRQFGFKVLSLTSEAFVRFEIQMGQCGVLLLCHTVRGAIHHDLAQLFNQFCEGGVIVFVMHPVRREEFSRAHLCILDSDFADKLHLIQGLRSERRKIA